MLRWGLIGTSTIAREWMIPAIRANGGEVVSVTGSDPVRVRGYARDQGIAVAASGVAELLAKASIDAVYISTTNEKHQELTLAAANAGKHVLCEKPLAMSVAGARAMVAACQHAGVVLGTNHHLRNAITHRTLRRLVSEGAIGQPLAARVFHAVFLPPHLQRWRIDNPAAGGGVVLDITVHDADTLRFVLADEVAEVTAMTASQGMAAPGLEDAVMGVMRFRDGALAQFHDAFTIAHTATGLEVHGTEGSLLARDMMTQQPIGSIQLRRGDREEVVDLAEPTNLYERSVQQFAAAVVGRGEPAATGEDGVRSLAIALAVRQSASERRAVTVDYGDETPA